MVSRRGVAASGCLVWLLLIGAGAYVGAHVGAPYYRYYQYRDAVSQQLRFATLRSDDAILHSIYASADSIGVPEGAYHLNIARTPSDVHITGAYDDVWSLPNYSRLVHFTIDADTGI